MPKFDVKTFFELTGRGGGPVAALGTAFGMPSCMLNLAADVLSLIPSPILASMRTTSSNGAARADDVIKALSNKLRNTIGIIEFDTEDGVFRFVSDSSQNGLDKNQGGVLGALRGFLNAAGAAAGFAGRLYNNYQTASAQIQGIRDCIKSYKDYLDYSGGEIGDRLEELSQLNPDAYSQLINDEYANDIQDISDAAQFKLDALALQNNIDRILAARLKDPSLEPEFTDDYINLLSGTNLRVQSPSAPPPKEEVFRLDFGPPKSKEGKFILSINGLYYDSQTSGILPALLEIENKKSTLPPNLRWKLDYDPNIGGRGTPMDIQSLNYYFNTILDPNILDDSDFMLFYYSQDVLLQDLIGQRNRKIYDISGSLQVLIDKGESQILISNLRQVMLSEASHFFEKINKRKKQIELAVKLPVLYKGRSIYAPGEIPINDFSYLEGTNYLLDINKQRKIVINQADVESVVLPLQVKFTQQIDSPDEVVLEHLLLNNIAAGNIISNPSGTGLPSLSLTNSIITDRLIALYNCLTCDVDVYPSSTNFGLFNSSDKGIDYNAQLVGDSENIFDKGLGIVYLHGITKNDPSNQQVVSGVGSYIKIPAKPEFQDFIYSFNGATFETWVHVPELDGSRYGFNYLDEVSGLYRLILANENTGLGATVSAQSNILNMTKDEGTGVVNGLIYGFTRDRRFTQNALPSNNEMDNKTETLALVLAPTQSFDSSSVGFINRAFYDNNSCASSTNWHGMVVDVWNTYNGYSLSSCGREFVLLTLVFDPPMNQVKIYMDGNLMAASSYGDVFGKNAEQGLPNIPSLKKNNSFEYNSSYMSATGNIPEIMGGPKLDSYFTPWIIGGGYTDGNPNGNFMGGLYGGRISGLKGYLGGIKFYSKPLDQSEILNNFEATKLFFKNIEVPNLMWEPILIETE